MSEEPPFAEAEAEAGESAAAQARAGIRVRLAELLGRDDPVLGPLVLSTALATLGRGVFLTALVLYLTLIARLTPEQIALAVAVSAVAGMAASYLGGWLSDRVSARRITVAGQLVGSLVLIGYVWVDGVLPAIVVGSVSFFAGSMGHAASSAIIARGFEGPGRVRARAVMRTVTNVGIALGSAAAAIPILLSTPEAYRIALVVAALLSFVGALPLLRLPPRVDAGGVRTAEEEAVAPVRGRSPWRDARYLAFVLLSSIFAIQFSVLDYAMPLWIAHATEAPIVVVSVLIILNTVVVTSLTVPLSKGTDDVRRAGRVFAVAGVLMAAACVVYALAAGAPVWLAILVLVLGALAHALAEVLSQAAGWGLSFELADPESAGAYQGLVGMGWGVVSAVGPPVIAITALQFGLPGWILLGGIFLASSLGILWIGRRAALATA
ncbi:MFS transporter [Protaetiibacter mangrovi]|uniref:MFS transporter n=1 Tax=Protaetiibacter mangrovi TaxID=2970926 RepID=A0ABT1ZEL1_9MICO|nr:MFS transporter [Protaetiibacter mangrovi]MCS0499133.1 MFS transporter [Protaetiibacter mangrovi]